MNDSWAVIVQTLLHGIVARKFGKNAFCSGGLALIIQPVRGSLLMLDELRTMRRPRVALGMSRQSDRGFH